MNFVGTSFSATDVSGSYTFNNSGTVVIGIQVANSGTVPATVDITLRGSYILKGGGIPVGSSLSVLDGKIVCNATESIVATTGTGESVDVTLSFMEA